MTVTSDKGETKAMTALSRFIDDLQDLLQVPAELGDEAVGVAAIIQQRLAMPVNHIDSVGRSVAIPCPIPNTLDWFADAIPNLPKDLQSISDNLVNLADSLPWYRRPEPAYAEFMQAHANAQVIGPQGLLVRHDIMVGVSLINSHITYPDHWHPPAEIYLVLTPGLWRQNEDEWHEPGIGGYVYNPPNIVHAMQTQQSPLLAIWCLPL